MDGGIARDTVEFPRLVQKSQGKVRKYTFPRLDFSSKFQNFMDFWKKIIPDYSETLKS
jgi:hypothetical protein